MTDPAPPPPEAAAPVNLTALLAEALGKSDVAWIRTPAFTRAVWYAYDRDAVLLVTGPGEQQIPPLPQECELLVRSKDAGSRLVTHTVQAVVLSPEHPMWPVAAAALAAKRLNATDDQVTRWRESCTIYALHPFGEPSERPGSYAASGPAVPLEPAGAVTKIRRPFHLRGRSRR